MDRLRRRADFLAVANGARINSPGFALPGRATRRRGPGPGRLHRYQRNGTAAESNRIRRRLRELVKRPDAISMRPHHDYVLVGRRDALTRDFAAMLDDLRSALIRLDRQPATRRRDAAAATELNDETLNDDRQSQHHPRRHSVRPCADRLAVFLQRAADGKAARADPNAEPNCRSHAAGEPGPARHHAAARRGAGASAPAPTSPSAPSSAAKPPSPPARASRSTRRALSGSISLKGARIDDLSLVQFRETVDPKSPAIVLYLAIGHGEPYYAEFGWVAGGRLDRQIPDQNTVWQQEGSGA